MFNKKGLIILFFLYMAFSLEAKTSGAEAGSSFWQTEKSQHFIIYYQEAPYGYVRDLINRAEYYYNSIVDNLGYRRFDFWSWDNRAKVYLYKDAGSYIGETKRASWSAAMVNIKKRTIKTFISQENFLDSILPHEMAHIIFREFIGEKQALPLWLDEGVACAQEKDGPERLKIAKNLVEMDTYINLSRLSEIRDATLVVPKVFYAESASLVIFLLEKYGKDKFLDFSRRLRDEGGWQEALKEAYRFKDLSDMEEEWKKFILGG